MSKATCKDGSVSAEYVLITPEMAQEWLDKANKMNRKTRKDKIRQTRDTMTAGDFDGLNGDSIVFDTDNVLADGQHRLIGIAESGVALETLVVRGVRPASRVTIDDGAKRRFADDLQMNGVMNSVMKSGLLRKILVWTEDQGFAKLSDARFTRQEMFAAWPQFGEQVNITTDHETVRWWHRWPGNTGAMIFMWWLLVHHLDSDPAVVRRFMSIMSIGSQDEADAVLIRCADKLKSYLTVTPNGTKRMAPVDEEMYFLITAWNGWLLGNNVRFSLPAAGLTNPYPVAVPALKEVV